MVDKGILRVIDANFNRCKEGLRVVEDIFRFVLKHDDLRKILRKLRHSLDKIAQEEILKEAILSRDSKRDLGKKCDNLEIKRKDVNSLIYINLQRVKESLRVLEEFFKLIIPRHVSKIKKIRYEIYELEKKILKKWPPLRNPRQRSN
ncbi:MAG: thiamine-phosphate pyrophosphorylase [Candidatus Omnitrophica bacterium]|nr:thiamine-phosphate pyrophosphorylase [Candidatus Omnitrophota bacterium]